MMSVLHAVSTSQAEEKPRGLLWSSLQPATQTRLMVLSQTAQQATPLISDPPAVLRRFGDAWRKYADEGEVSLMQKTCASLLTTLQRVANLKIELIDGSTVEELQQAVNDAANTVERVHFSAIKRAAEAPWHTVMEGKTLERIARPGTGSPAEAALGGKVVLLYFTAGWCGPCRRFCPALLDTYQKHRKLAATGKAPRDLEVVSVSWDRSADEMHQYARHFGMDWLAVPFEDRALVDELSLRYNVQSIPTVVALEVDASGRAVRVLSTEGRQEVERQVRGGSVEWLRDLLG